MSIRPLNKENTKWQIDYYPTGGKGKRIREVFEGKETAAHAYELEARRQHYGPSVNKISPKVIDVLPDYYEYLRVHRSPRYLEDMKGAFRHLMPFFGHKLLSQITLAHINKYKTQRPRSDRKQYKNTSAIPSINKELRYLRTFYVWCVKHEYANSLPFRIEKIPYRPPIQEIAHPSDIERLMNAVKRDASRKKALLLFLFECGLRWTEAVNIKWENVDFKQGLVYLTVTKGNRPDTCFLTDKLKSLLSSFTEEEGFVFLNRKTGKPWTSIKTLLSGACKRAGIKLIKPHQLRRSGATMMLEATQDMRLVQEFLRHKQITTTQLYTMVSKSRLREGMNRTSDYVRQQIALQPLENKKKTK